MKRLSVSILALVLVLSAFSAAAASAPKDSLALPVNGTFTDALGGTGTFNGTFHLTRFRASGNQLFADGWLTGTMTNSLGVSLGTVMKSASMPVDLSTATAARGRNAISTTANCDILHLVLGPLHLDLLGLVVDLNQVVLDIDAESGSGNLLGNLLCAVVNLLNGTGPLSEIANLLNQILDILNGILG